MASDREILPLTGLRGALAWWVIVFHFGRDLVPTIAAQRVAAAGHAAVDVFFVLSGYVLARRYAGVDLRARAARHAFWVRRVARVYPLYLVSLLIGFAASWPRSIGELALAKGQLCAILQLALLNAWSHHAMFAHNWAAWSLSVEVLFYAVAPWLFAPLHRLPQRGLALVIGLSWAATFVAPAVYTALDPDHLGRPFALGDEVLWGWYLKFFPLQRIPEFVAGAAAAFYFSPTSSRRARPFVPLASGVAFVALAASPLIPFAYLHSGVLLPLVLALIVSLDRDSASWLGGKLPVALGRASYATYVFHVPIFLLLARFDPALWQDGAHVVAYSALLLIVSLVTHAVLEEPARRWLTHRVVPR